MNKLLRVAASSMVVVLALGGCVTRSISNSGYSDSYRAQHNPFYHGELSELDVLGINPRQAISERDIESAAAPRPALALKRGAKVMLIQSGAITPDEAMFSAANRYFATLPFSGVPYAAGERGEQERAGYAQALRLAAARGGAQFIVCYWGMLESEVKGHATKAVSWIPIVGNIVPDESQHMRIRLKFVVMEVKSGQWTTMNVAPFEDRALSNNLGRASADQNQVAWLKSKAYEQAAQELLKVVL